jgi:drug/metabolite transporter, DME family
VTLVFRKPPILLQQNSGPGLAAAGAVVASLIWSSGAITSRFADSADAWQYLLWRSFGVLVVIEVLAKRAGKPPQVVVAFRSGRTMWIATVGLFVASLGFVYAVKNTTAANASFFASLSPIAASLLAWIVLRERLRWKVVIASIIGLAGLLVMALAPTVDSAVGIAPTLRGNLGGLACSIGFAVYVVALRTDSSRDWSPTMAGYTAVMIGVCIVVTVISGNTLFPPVGNIGLALFHGAVVIVIGTFLFNWASKSVGAVAMVLLAQVEIVTVPLWIFLIFGERPTTRGLVGALLILIAVLISVTAASGQRIGQGIGQVDGRPTASAEIVAESKPLSSVRPGR